jgi:DNA-binding PadR family transcriptional regulator
MKHVTVGELELAALLSVVRLGADAYGASIRRDLSDLAGRDYSVGAIYTTLQRLEDKGLVTSVMTEPTAVRGGRTRRRFRITRSGELTVARAHERRTAHWKGIPLRLKPV